MDGAEKTEATFTLTKDTAVSGVFAAISYTVTVSQPASGGRIDADKTSGIAGTTITLTNSPAEGYAFVHYTVDNVPITGSTVTLNKSVTVSGVFAEKHTVTVSQPANGTVSATPTSGAAGTVITLSNSPATGYTLAHYTVDNVQITGNTFTLNGNVTVSGVFDPLPTYTVSVTQPASGGTVGASAESGVSGTLITLTNSPAAHYAFTRYIVDGSPITGNTVTLSKNVTVSGEFAPINYTVTITPPAGGGGTISASPTSGVAGTHITLTNSPAEGYTFSKYIVGSTETTEATFTLNGNTTVSGVFVRSPTVVSGKTVWGNAATMTIPAADTAPITIEVTVTNNGSTAAPGSDDIAALANAVASGNSTRDVVVTYSNGGNAANGKIRFNVITALYAALKGKTSGTITQKSADGSAAVHPLFNGYDLFQRYNNIGSDKVFGVYSATAGNNAIFEGFTVKNDGSNKGWHIENTGNKPIYIERLKFKDGYYEFLKGFGLVSAAGNNTYVNPVITGNESATQTAAVANYITPEYLDAALGFLGLDYSAGANQLFTMENFVITNDFDILETTPKPLNTPGLKTLDFLEKYMGSSTDLAKLSSLLFGNTLNVTGSNPFTGNSYSPTPTLDGNLAAYLGQKNGFALRNLVVGNPSLFSSDIFIGILENIVFQGDNWKNLVTEGARGVIVSESTPVKSIFGSNVWYVVGGNVGRDTLIRLAGGSYTNVLEVRGSGSVGIWSRGPNSGNLKALITYDATQKAVLQGIFPADTGKYYETGGASSTPGGTRPTTTWKDWADAVAAGSTPTIQ